ncbi:hypothetical protein Hanom_Chr03g00212121 [Helianthus anomalus]
MRLPLLLQLNQPLILRIPSRQHNRRFSGHRLRRSHQLIKPRNRSLFRIRFTGDQIQKHSFQQLRFD